MLIKKVPEIDIIYKSKKIEPIKRDSIIEDIKWFFLKSDEANIKSFGIDNIRHAYIAYLYGQGGIGKTYTCKMLHQHLAVSYCQERKEENSYSVYYDVANGNDFTAKLSDLAALIKDAFNDQDIFPIFDYAYNLYLSKLGEQLRVSVESSSFSDDVADTVLGVTSCIPILSDAADLIDAGRSAIGLFKNYTKSKEISEKFHLVNKFSLDELKTRLGNYFAKDLNTYLEKNNSDRLIIILDTFEYLLYEDANNGRNVSSTDWLFGENGLVRTLVNVFWVIAGREKVDWSSYDTDNEIKVSFFEQEVRKLEETEVIDYLTRAGMQNKLAIKIATETKCLPLYFDRCLDRFINLWNRKIQEGINRGDDIDELKIDCNPTEQEVEELISISKISSIMSNRFLSYFNRQERDIILTLACLRKWNDELLLSVIWKNSIGSFTFYDEIKNLLFIERKGDYYEIAADSAGILVKNCPNMMKKSLVTLILKELESVDSMRAEHVEMLRYSLLHITLYYRCELNSWEKTLPYLYQEVYLLLRDEKFSDVDRLCKEFSEALRDSESNANELKFVSFSITVFQYVNSTICQTKHIPNPSCYDEAEKQIKHYIQNFTREDAEFIIPLAIQIVSDCLFRYQIYSEIQNFTGMILHTFNQEPEENFLKYNYYCVAVLIDIKACKQSWLQYGSESKYPHAIKISDVNVVFSKMELWIEVLLKHQEDYKSVLKNLLHGYISLGKRLIVISTEKDPSTADSFIRCHERYLDLYQKLIDPSILQELLRLRSLECQVALSDGNNQEAACKLAFEGLHMYVSEYGPDLKRLDQCSDLLALISKSLMCLGEKCTELFSQESIDSYRVLFQEILTDFCKTLDLRYHTLLRILSVINETLITEPGFGWMNYLTSLNRFVRKSLRKRVAIMMLYKYSGYLGNQVLFCEKGSEEICDVNYVLGYASNNNHFCFEVLKHLKALYQTSSGSKKQEIAELLFDFIADILYTGLNMHSDVKRQLLMCRIFQYIDYEFLIPIMPRITEVLDAIEQGDSPRYVFFDSCFGNFRGWIFYLNYEDDCAFNRMVIDTLYEMLMNIAIGLTENFYKAVNKTLSKMYDLEMYLETGQYLIRFLEHEFTDSSKFSVGIRRSTSNFNQYPEIKAVLRAHGILETDLDELIMEGDLEEAAIEFERLVESKRLLPGAKIYYEPIVFQYGDDVVFDMLDELKNDCGDMGFFRRPYLLKGYYEYKPEVFVAVVRENIEKLLMDSESKFASVISNYFEDMLKILAATGDGELVRKYVLHLKQHIEFGNRILLLNYDIIKDFVPILEIFDEGLVRELFSDFTTCRKLYNALKGALPEKQLIDIILEASKPALNLLIHGVEIVPEGKGIDGIYVRWLTEVLENKTNQTLSQEYLNAVETRVLYKEQFSIFR